MQEHYSGMAGAAGIMPGIAKAPKAKQPFLHTQITQLLDKVGIISRLVNDIANELRMPPFPERPKNLDEPGNKVLDRAISITVACDELHSLIDPLHQILSVIEDI